MIFETHAHYDDKSFEDDRNELIQSLNEHGVNYIVNVGASLETTRASIELAEKYQEFYAAAGVHPNETDELNEGTLNRLKQMVSHPKVVAVGEIGLDYHWDTPDREIQKKWFRKQIYMAQEKGLPIIIHSREAAQDTYDIIAHEYLGAKSRGERLSGVMHCFSYGNELADLYIDMGFYLGIGGVVTFKNAKKLKEVVKRVPLEYLVLETDCPYLAPEPFRGKRNSSLYLPYIAKEIACLKGIGVEQVMEATFHNAMNLYRIDK